MNLLSTKIFHKYIVVLRYVIVAGFAYAIDMGCYVFFIFIDVIPLWANFFGKVISIILSFFAHRYFTYTIKRADDVVVHGLRFLGVALINIQVSTFLLYVVMQFISNVVLAKFICDVFLFVLGYWVTSKFIFFTKNKVVGNNK
jgi:putative flippase GtrA